MVLKLYGPGFRTGGTALVAMVLREKEVPFEFVVVDMLADEHKSAEYIALQPFGQVPVIILLL